VKQTKAAREAGFDTPEDIADAALYLASDLVDYITDFSFVVDGGHLNTL
jgi:NAD(P)-dependent dehydrogenase (short-subunit alcohol dehydrogenase family)